MTKEEEAVIEAAIRWYSGAPIDPARSDHWVTLSEAIKTLQAARAPKKPMSAEAVRAAKWMAIPSVQWPDDLLGFTRLSKDGLCGQALHDRIEEWCRRVPDWKEWDSDIVTDERIRAAESAAWDRAIEAVSNCNTIVRGLNYATLLAFRGRCHAESTPHPEK